MMPGINGVHHVAISVPNLDQARRFYVELLGLREVWQSEWDERGLADSAAQRSIIEEILGLKNSAARQMMVHAGNIYLEIFEFAAPEQPPQDPHRPVHLRGYTHIAFDVHDLDAVHKRLSEAGIRFHTTPKHTPGISSTYGRDPFGNVFEIQELHEGSVVPNL